MRGFDVGLSRPGCDDNPQLEGPSCGSAPLVPSPVPATRAEDTVGDGDASPADAVAAGHEFCLRQ